MERLVLKFSISLLLLLNLVGCNQGLILQTGGAVVTEVAGSLSKSLSKRNVSTSDTAQPAVDFSSLSNNEICRWATFSGAWETRTSYKKYVQEAKRRSLSCRVKGTGAD